ncbi:MAG: hypothetical protein R3Y53_06725 [Bacillota bacterium]
MKDKERIAKVDSDITMVENALKEYGYDREKLTKVFDYLIMEYDSVVEEFCKGLSVVQFYDTPQEQVEVYNRNITLMCERLIAFRENKYKNVGLREYYIKKEYQEISFQVDFTQLRLEFGTMEKLKQRERNEIIERLDEMERICATVGYKKEKWDQLRGHLLWLSGKDVDVALKILPVFFKINHK